MPESSCTPCKGLVVVFTGNGKGKTSAAMGIMVRASGHGLRVSVIQFIKSPDRVYGEAQTAKRLNIPFLSMGDGFVFNRINSPEARDAALHAWDEARAQVIGGRYDVIILDEITYLFKYNWLDVTQTMEWLKKNKPESLHLILTGRDAPKELVDYADMVTEMREIKHPFHEQNLPAQQGVDY
jgi:cob(I)alamin adenosyltransferase